MAKILFSKCSSLGIRFTYKNMDHMKSSMTRPEDNCIMIDRAIIVYLGQSIIIWLDSYDMNHILTKFISLADGAGMIQHKMLWIFQNQTFLDLIEPFSPGYYRFGGTRNDLLFFDEDSPGLDFDPNDCSLANEMSGGLPISFLDESLEHQNITRHEIGRIYNAVKCSGLELIYGLNLNYRKNDEWISSNTEALLKFISESSMKMHFELGNEPNSYYHKFGTDMTPKMQTHDIRTLKKLLKNNDLQESKIFGPDTTSSHVNGLTYLLRKVFKMISDTQSMFG